MNIAIKPSVGNKQLAVYTGRESAAERAIRSWYVNRGVELVKEMGKTREKPINELSLHDPAYAELRVFYDEHVRANKMQSRTVQAEETVYIETTRKLTEAINTLDLRIDQLVGQNKKLEENAQLAELKRRIAGKESFLSDEEIGSINAKLIALRNLGNEVVANRQELKENVGKLENADRRLVEVCESVYALEVRGTTERLRELERFMGKPEGRVIGGLDISQVKSDIERQLALATGYLNSYGNTLFDAEQNARIVLKSAERTIDKVEEALRINSSANEAISNALAISEARRLEAGVAHIENKEAFAARINRNENLRKLKNNDVSTSAQNIERINTKLVRLNNLLSKKAGTSEERKKLEDSILRLVKDIEKDANKVVNNNPILNRKIFIARVGEMFSELGEIISSPFRSFRQFITTGLAIISLFTMLNSNMIGANATPPPPGSSARAATNRDMTKEQMYVKFRDEKYKNLKLKTERNLALTQNEFRDIEDLYQFVVRNYNHHMTRDRFYKLFAFEGPTGTCLVGNAGPGWEPVDAIHISYKYGIETKLTGERKARALRGLGSLLFEASTHHNDIAWYTENKPY